MLPVEREAAGEGLLTALHQWDVLIERGLAFDTGP